jgi:hypothetical protein
MGNILNSQPNIKLIRYLNNFHIKFLNVNDHIKLEEFKFKATLNLNDISLFTTYEYQKIYHHLPTNFILCRSLSVNEIIENTLFGDESIAYISYDCIGKQKIFNIKDILGRTKISCYEVDLIEIHKNITSKSCKTLQNHRYLNLQDDQTYFSENDLIDGIMSNFVYYPINKKLLIDKIISNDDIKFHIFNLYINLLYIF